MNNLISLLGLVVIVGLQEKNAIDNELLGIKSLWLQQYLVQVPQ